MHRDVVMPYPTLIYIVKVIGVYKASTQVLTDQLKHIGYPQKIKAPLGAFDIKKNSQLPFRIAGLGDGILRTDRSQYLQSLPS